MVSHTHLSLPYIINLPFTIQKCEHITGVGIYFLLGGLMDVFQSDHGPEIIMKTVL
jgi:hypothetical protein